MIHSKFTTIFRSRNDICYRVAYACLAGAFSVMCLTWVNLLENLTWRERIARQRCLCCSSWPTWKTTTGLFVVSPIATQLQKAVMGLLLMDLEMCLWTALFPNLAKLICYFIKPNIGPPSFFFFLHGIGAMGEDSFFSSQIKIQIVFYNPTIM